VHGRRPGHQRHELGRVETGDRRWIQVLDTHPGGDRRRARERPFHRDLLVQQHADDQCERVSGKERVGPLVLRQP
jgi:hypothetical protein